jgi:hypothetical protein
VDAFLRTNRNYGVEVSRGMTLPDSLLVSLYSTLLGTGASLRAQGFSALANSSLYALILCCMRHACVHGLPVGC